MNTLEQTDSDLNVIGYAAEDVAGVRLRLEKDMETMQTQEAKDVAADVVAVLHRMEALLLSLYQ